MHNESQNREIETDEEVQDYWIVKWIDIGHDRELCFEQAADTVEEALETIHRILKGETAVDESSFDSNGDFVGGEEPAYDVMFAAGNPSDQLRQIIEPLEQECDNGTLIVSRCFRRLAARQPHRNEAKSASRLELAGEPTGECLTNAARDLFDFAKLFLAYHDNETDDDVTIETLERTARAAIAKATTRPNYRPLAGEMIAELKEDYLKWTGGFPPDNDQEIFVYVELNRPVGADPEEVWSVLREWMNNAKIEIEADPALPLPEMVIYTY